MWLSPDHALKLFFFLSFCVAFKLDNSMLEIKPTCQSLKSEQNQKRTKPLVNSVLRRPSIETYALCLASGANLIFKIDSDGTTIGLELSVCGQIGVIFIGFFFLFFYSKQTKISNKKLSCSLESTIFCMSLYSIRIFTKFRVKQKKTPFQNGGNKWMDHTSPSRACVSC